VAERRSTTARLSVAASAWVVLRCRLSRRGDAKLESVIGAARAVKFALKNQWYLRDMNALSSLTDAQLLTRFKKLGRIHSVALVNMVLCLAEICRRRTHLAAGYPNLAEYCRAVNGEERSKAWRLGLAAEAVASYPLAGELLESRQLSVSALVAVKYALTGDNHAQLLRGAIGLTEDEAAVLASQFRPSPRRTDSIRPVSVLRPAFVSPPGATERAPTSPTQPNALSASPTSSSAPPVELVLEQRMAMQISVSLDVHAQLEEVKLALSHKVPNGNLNDILAECFRITLDVCERRKIGAPARSTASNETSAPLRLTTSTPAEPNKLHSVEVLIEGQSPRDATEMNRVSIAAPLSLSSADAQHDLSDGSPPPAPSDPYSFAVFESRLDDRSRNVAVSCRRPVWERDQGRCSFRGADGHLCGSRYQLEFDHWRPYSQGGEHSVANIRLLCSAHNRFEAERILGPKLMRKYFRRVA
jgi:hypothetical protein